MNTRLLDDHHGVTNGKASAFVAAQRADTDEDSLSFDEKVFRLIRRGWTQQAVARELECCRKTIYNSLRRHAERAAEELLTEKPSTFIGQEAKALEHQRRRCELFLEHLLASGKVDADTGKRHWSTKQVQAIQAQERLVMSLCEKIIDLRERVGLLSEDKALIETPAKKPEKTEEDQPFSMTREQAIERIIHELRTSPYL